jgi:hypothetical protein
MKQNEMHIFNKVNKCLATVYYAVLNFCNYIS